MPGASNGPCSMPVTPCVANAERLVFHQRSRAASKSTSGCPVTPRLSPSARGQAYASGYPVHASDEECAVMPLIYPVDLSTDSTPTAQVPVSVSGPTTGIILGQRLRIVPADHR